MSAQLSRGIPPVEGSNICQSVQVLVPESKRIETKWTRYALEGATKFETVHGEFQNSNWSTNFPIILLGLRIPFAWDMQISIHLYSICM